MNNIVEVSWLAQNINNKNIIVLDASPTSNKAGLTPKFTNIQISNARFFDTENVFVDAKNELPNMFLSEAEFQEKCRQLGINNESIIVVYDNIGIYMSPRVWWMFKTFGHNNVAVLNGGLNAWVEAGFTSEKKIKKTYTKGNFTANFITENIVTANAILNNISSEEFLVLDARSEGRFKGEIPEPRENMQQGHIPNSKNIHFKEVLNEGKLKSKKQLNKIFSAEVETNKKLVFTCGSGVTACIVLLASMEVNKNKHHALYDGSWTEWGLGTKFPVIK